MKKIIYIFLLISSFAVNAQNDKELGFRFSGIFTHPNQTGMAGSQADFFFKKQIANNLSVLTGFGYRVQDQRENLIKIKEKISTKSIMLPIGLQYHVYKNSFIKTGIELDILMSAKRDGNTIAGIDEDVKDKYNSLNGVVFFDVGYQIKKVVNVTAGYRFGLSPKLIHPDAFGVTKTNNYISVGIGWIVKYEQ